MPQQGPLNEQRPLDRLDDLRTDLTFDLAYGLAYDLAYSLACQSLAGSLDKQASGLEWFSRFILSRFGFRP